MIIISQVVTTEKLDYWLSYWIILEDIKRIENTSGVKQFVFDMYNNNFLGSIFMLNSESTACWALWIPCTHSISSPASFLHRFVAFFACRSLMNSNSNFHNITFFKLLQARISFFHNNPSGELRNPIVLTTLQKHSEKFFYDNFLRYFSGFLEYFIIFI